MAVVADRVSVARGALVWWHLLSLDAPAVAGLWTWFVGRCFGVRLPAVWPVAMFLAVWVLYAGDRVLDARARVGLEERHRFHGEHRWGFGAGMIACGAGLAALAPWVVSPAGYGALGLLLVVWLSVVHLAADRPLPKEMVVGGFFGAAVFLPVLGRSGSWVAGVGFALLCTLNCLYIHAWEEAAQAHAWTLWGVRHVDWMVGALIAGALLDRHLTMGAEGAAAGLLWGLNRARGRMDRTTLRAAADLTLLTPLLALPWLR